jgi:hypothetical protein
MLVEGWGCFVYGLLWICIHGVGWNLKLRSSFVESMFFGRRWAFVCLWKRKNSVYLTLNFLSRFTFVTKRLLNLSDFNSISRFSCWCRRQSVFIFSHQLFLFQHKRRKRRWLPNRLCHRLIQLLPKCIQVGQFTLPLLLIPSHVYENNFF